MKLHRVAGVLAGLALCIWTEHWGWGVFIIIVSL